jgi:hypothetical protein
VADFHACHLAEATRKPKGDAEQHSHRRLSRSGSRGSRYFGCFRDFGFPFPAASPGSSAYFVSRSSSRLSLRASFLQARSCNSGIVRATMSTSFATVKKIGPSSAKLGCSFFQRWRRLFRSGALVPQQDLQALHFGYASSCSRVRLRSSIQANRARHRSSIVAGFHEPTTQARRLCNGRGPSSARPHAWQTILLSGGSAAHFKNDVRYV